MEIVCDINGNHNNHNNGGAKSKLTDITYAEEQKALTWLEDIIDEGLIFEGSRSIEVIGEKLRNGVFLCKLMTQLQPSLNSKIEEPDSEANCVRNIQTFLTDCLSIGIPYEDLFEVDHLYRSTDIAAVLKTIIVIKTRFLCKNSEIPLEHLDTPYPVDSTQFTY